MSAYTPKADVLGDPEKCLLIAKSGRRLKAICGNQDACWKRTIAGHSIAVNRLVLVISKRDPIVCFELLCFWPDNLNSTLERMRMPSSSISYTTRDGETLDGYLTHPDGDGPFPGILLITAIFGIDDEMIELADAWAADGFIVSVPGGITDDMAVTAHGLDGS